MGGKVGVRRVPIPAFLGSTLAMLKYDILPFAGLGLISQLPADLVKGFLTSVSNLRKPFLIRSGKQVQCLQEIGQK